MLKQGNLVSATYQTCTVLGKSLTKVGGRIDSHQAVNNALVEARLASKFDDVLKSSIDYYVEKTISVNMSEDFADGKKGYGKSCGDFEIACVLKQMFKHEYVCVSIKNNVWYRFYKHRWVEIDSGTTLRKAISTDMRDVYEAKPGV